MSDQSLEALLSPKSVAVLGASPRTEAMGHIVVKNLLSFGYQGRIFPVHPSATHILDLECFDALDSLPERPDCVVVALAAKEILAVLDQIGRLGVSNVVIFASGFAESGPEGALLQDQLQSICERYGINVCGPNCLGLINVTQGIPLYSAAIPADLQPGGLALLSHSGSACILLSSLDRFHFSHLISLGNGMVTDMEQYLDYMVDDAATHVVALFMETVRHPKAFGRAALRMRAAGKPMVVLKVGRSESGAATSAAHTGAIAASDDVFKDYCQMFGITLVEDFDELVETCSLFLKVSQMPKGRGLGVMGVSGGELALVCDMAERVGLVLPELAERTLDALDAVMPTFVKARNPLDVTGVGVFDTTLYRQCLQALLEDPGIDLVAVSQDIPSALGEGQAQTYHALSSVVADVAKHATKPIVFFSNVSGNIHPLVAAPLDAVGVPVLRGSRASLTAIRRLFDWAAWLPPSKEQQGLSASNRSVEWAKRLGTRQVFTERESTQFLSDYGVSCVATQFASTAEDAVKAARVLGYPVAMKVEAAGILHKSDVGGVVLNLRADREVVDAFHTIMRTVSARLPEAALAGVLIQEMVDAGVEAIVGIVNHRPFGPAVVVGSGGVLVELLDDAALALAPFGVERAHELIAATRLDKLLGGYRGGKALDKDALAQLLVRVSEIAHLYDDSIEELDLNPVTVLPEGRGVRVLDALLIPRT